MGHLTLAFLGGFEATLDARPVTGYGTDKTRALLAYLAIEAQRPHRRSDLAALLWPESPEKNAAHNLRQSLLRLRQALGMGLSPLTAPFLLINQQDIQFNDLSDSRVDVTRFRALLSMVKGHQHAQAVTCEICQQWLLQAIDLYRGELLAGMYVADSLEFEEWRVIQQEELRGQAVQVLEQLSKNFEQRGEFERAQEAARREMALDPWKETAHLRLISALTKSGQVGMAIKHFEMFQRGLQEALGIKPSTEAMRMVERLRTGELLPTHTGEEDSGGIWVAERGERRQVTVVACGRAEPDEMEEAGEASHFCCGGCETIFKRLGGQRALRQGSECLIFFGYPQAYEDAPRRAVHCALEAAQQAMDEGPALSLGVHTGMLLVGESRGLGWMERDLFGTALDVVRDCRRKAQPSEVVISGETHHLVQDLFDCEAIDASEKRLRVCKENSLLHRLEWLAQTQRLTQFSGRERELAGLRALVEQTRQGQGHSVLVQGEPGIGKSRLIWELKRTLYPEACPTAAGENRVRTAWFSSRCLPYYQNTSLYPITGLLEALLEFNADDSPDTRIEKLTAMLGRYDIHDPAKIWLLAMLLGLSTNPPAPEVISKSQREQMRILFVALVQRRAAEGRVVLHIEDMHWADPSTIEWLGASIPALAAARCLLVLSARPSFKPAWLEDKAVQPALTVLPLSPLSNKDVERMLRDLGGKHGVDDVSRRRIIDQADGIPLFVEELAKARLDSTGKHQPEVNPSIPVTLVDSLTARLDHLGTARETAQWAAVLGREFSYLVLEACVPYDAMRLQSDLARMVEAGLAAPVASAAQDLRPLIQVGEQEYLRGRYSFKHSLVQEAVYGSLLKSTRRQHHQRVAEVIQTRFPHMGELRPEVLAHHQLGAGDTAGAVRSWLRAGERTLAQGATSEAGVFFDLALRHVRSKNKGEVDVLMEAACLLAAGKLARMRGDFSQALEHLEPARAAYQAAGEPGGVSKVLIEMGVSFSRKGQFEAARGVLREGLKLARDVNDKPGIAQALNISGNTEYFAGELAQARRFYEESLVLRRELNDLWGIAGSLNNISVVLDVQGDRAAARSTTEESLRLRRQLGDKPGIANSLNNLGIMAFAERAYDEAERLYSESLAVLREVDDQWGIAVALNNVGDARRVLDDFEAARAYYAESLAVAADTDNQRARGYSLIGLGLVGLGAGHFDEACTYIWDSIRLRQDLGDKSGIADGLAALAKWCAAQGKAGEAAQLSGAAHRLYTSIEAHPEPDDHLIESARRILGEAAYQAAWAEGEKMNMEQALVWAGRATGCA